MGSQEQEKRLTDLRKLSSDKAKNSLLESLGIEILSIDESGVKGKMPVDRRTHQFYGVLHGGASVALAETLCSIGAHAFLDTNTQMAVGQEINANHVRSVESGWVYGEAQPIHLGKRTQIWQIDIKNEAGKLVCISRCTMAIIDKP